MVQKARDGFFDGLISNAWTGESWTNGQDAIPPSSIFVGILRRDGVLAVS